MSDNFIYGCNPLVVSRIVSVRFRRHFKTNLYYKILGKKHPILRFFGFTQGHMFDGYTPAYVSIRGGDNKELKRIVCRSNKHAEELSAELNEKLNNFLEDLKLNNVQVNKDD